MNIVKRHRFGVTISFVILSLLIFVSIVPYYSAKVSNMKCDGKCVCDNATMLIGQNCGNCFLK